VARRPTPLARRSSPQPPQAGEGEPRFLVFVALVLAQRGSVKTQETWI
jgi:hypothetical protein